MKKNAIWIISVLSGIIFGGSIYAGEIVLSNGSKKVGKVVARPDGTLTIATAEGSFTYKPGQYVSATGDEPPELRQGVSAFRTGNHDQAKQLLEKVVRSNSFLRWDGIAAEWLLKTYNAAGESASGNRIVEQIEKRYGGSTYERFPGLERAKLETMTKTKSKWGEVETQLNEIINTSKSRDRAAYAQMTRGDLRLEQSKPKDAVVDYLRTVYFFEAQEDVHPEAIYKTAKAFEAMQDTKRAKDFYDRLVADYPDHPLAQQVAGQ